MNNCSLVSCITTNTRSVTKGCKKFSSNLSFSEFVKTISANNCLSTVFPFTQLLNSSFKNGKES